MCLQPFFLLSFLRFLLVRTLPSLSSFRFVCPLNLSVIVLIEGMIFNEFEYALTAKTFSRKCLQFSEYLNQLSDNMQWDFFSLSFLSLLSTSGQCDYWLFDEHFAASEKKSNNFVIRYKHGHSHAHNIPFDNNGCGKIPRKKQRHMKEWEFRIFSMIFLILVLWFRFVVSIYCCWYCSQQSVFISISHILMHIHHAH